MRPKTFREVNHYLPFSGSLDISLFKKKQATTTGNIMNAVCKRQWFCFQAIRTDLVPFLLKLLEGGLETLDKPAATKAQIVKALKSMQRSFQYGEQVSQDSLVTKYKVNMCTVY